MSTAIDGLLGCLRPDSPVTDTDYDDVVVAVTTRGQQALLRERRTGCKFGAFSSNVLKALFLSKTTVRKLSALKARLCEPAAGMGQLRLEESKRLMSHLRI